MFLSVLLDYPQSVVKLARVTGSEILEAIFMLHVCLCVCVHNQHGRLLRSSWENQNPGDFAFLLLSGAWTEPWQGIQQPLFCSHLSPWWQDLYPGDLTNAFAACCWSIYFWSRYWQNDVRPVQIYKWFCIFASLPQSSRTLFLIMKQIGSKKSSLWFSLNVMYSPVHIYIHTHFSNSTTLCNFNPITYQQYYLCLKHS